MDRLLIWHALFPKIWAADFPAVVHKAPTFGGVEIVPTGKVPRQPPPPSSLVARFYN